MLSDLGSSIIAYGQRFFGKVKLHAYRKGRSRLSILTALSPLDGRYAGKVDALREHFSEFGLIRARLKVEIEWLKALSAEPHFAEIAAFSPATVAELDALVAISGRNRQPR